MRSSKQFAVTAISAVLLWPAVTRAQAKAPEMPLTHYKLTYRLLQVGEDGKITNSRTYSALIAAGSGDIAPAKIRAEDRFPISAGGNNSVYNYQNIGTNIDTFHASIHDRQLSLHVSAESSSLAKAPTDVPNAPVVRRTSWESNVVVTLDKPTIIFTSDNVSDTGKTELELTAAEIKQP